jgi:hypothetical protein
MIGTIIICATRSIGLSVNAFWLRFQSGTMSWPW